MITEALHICLNLFLLAPLPRRKENACSDASFLAPTVAIVIIKRSFFLHFQIIVITFHGMNEKGRVDVG